MSDQGNEHANHDGIDNAGLSAEVGSGPEAKRTRDEPPEQTASDEAVSNQSPDSTIGLSDAQVRAREAAKELLEYEFEGIIKIEAANGDGWRTVVELVERNAVPDTQDIIGRYEITLDATGSVTGYELLERYRRGDMKEEL
ncbi:gas vesicle protein [Haloferax mediterranei ATCC 33500]|uniref:Gas vesicle protein O n=2 Tax=Haloferax mediterranei (strain ATCC 33500 / DSM 1411 / JCM 8866 / NBRC 14739 / NCIMB 2177 / R-4) TaxID=523841 RepID=GVPO_HALMT|nr:gas vesicle protein [Haloferax mediterranei]Q02240.1 RecName: Full=Gas vesicle protein O; Short=GvpO [Haloferax mediterranei ATCC 33500]AFK19399.1 gas-vesicle operon protein gvpO [Haloferax mediterranei ATCC 33500]AHZ21251.1 protein gvpO [Haloferax mediterranei ATCC 33500]EMA04412.1 gas-vesicle operon protein gvpO [Haloferax mediterranei ATCC 33500]MDX5989502.1 gas vesicle protein [Haloferax mediterranei ATCC 33500]QCQ75861.1 gas vesicle protein [Haloferax mediterranei ATCC 33500]